MISLDQVSEMVKELQAYASSAEMQEDVLRQKNKDLFFALLREDSFFIVASDPGYSEEIMKQKSFLPFIAAAHSESKIPYMRLFSHKEAALKFMSAAGLTANCCVSISATESAQLAKYWFLRGVYGFMLNDGFQWTTISFPEYLAMIFEDLLGRPEMYNEEYVAWISFLLLLDNKESFRMEIDGKLLRLVSDNSGTAILPDILEHKDTEGLELEVQHPLMQTYRGTLTSFIRAMNEYHADIPKGGVRS